MRALAFAFALLATPCFAQAPDTARVVDTHIVPGYHALSEAAGDLVTAAEADCSPTSEDLRAAYHDAFDAWVSVSHLRFGPAEVDQRAFALAFWPDPRGSTAKTLATMIRDTDPVVNTPEDFATVSVAARGFYALEFLLFDPQFTDGAAPEYRCALVQAIAGDVSRNADDIIGDWQSGYGDLMTNPGNDTYRTADEAAQQLFTALTTGLEFTESQRLGRPLGTFDRPRPNRAEARRSGRSLRHVILSLEATRELAFLIAEDATLDEDFAEALEDANALDDAVLAGVADPTRRFRIEALQQRVTNLRRYLLEQVGPRFGITAGFNSLDGD